MQQRQLGKDGPMVSVLGLGAWPIGGGMGLVDEQVAIDTIRAAIDSGITLIDTAQGYKTSEATLGKALKSGYRDKCFLATKVSVDYSSKGIISAMENSLRALDVDHVDLYQIHTWDPRYPVEESMEAMAQLQQQGKTRYIGVSNFNAEQMQQAMNVVRINSNQPRYNLFAREIEQKEISFCEKEGVGILAHSPLAKGILSGKYTVETTFPADDERSGMPRFKGERFRKLVMAADQLKEVASDKGLTLIQLSIAWLLNNPAVTTVLLGAKTPTQVEGYPGAIGVTFTSEELARIDEIVGGCVGCYG